MFEDKLILLMECMIIMFIVHSKSLKVILIVILIMYCKDLIFQFYHIKDLSITFIKKITKLWIQWATLSYEFIQYILNTTSHHPTWRTYDFHMQTSGLYIHYAPLNSSGLYILIIHISTLSPCICVLTIHFSTLSSCLYMLYIHFSTLSSCLYVHSNHSPFSGEVFRQY